MRTIIITGAGGFLGRNLSARLSAREDVRVLPCHRGTDEAELASMAAAADVVFHLAGVNRPRSEDEFHSGNAGFTAELTQLLRRADNAPTIVFASSVQAEHDNAYGRSKRAAETVLMQYARDTGARTIIFRLRNIFGKWSRPHYNSVVATFCHSISHDQPITIHDLAREIELVYIDDVVDRLVAAAERTERSAVILPDEDGIPFVRISLADLAERIRSFRAMRETLKVPDLSDAFNRALYATYLSYVEPEEWEYGLQRRHDERGDLAEFIKSSWFGQIFVSRTNPGSTRGNHYHHTKTEKFLVVAGEAVVRFRHVEREDIIEFTVRGVDYRVIDIPPGYTHSITNVGAGEVITLFWASEIFDPAHPDTVHLPVIPQGAPSP